MATARRKLIRQKSSPKVATGWVKGGQIPTLCIFLALLTFVSFAQTLRHDFVDFDDDEYVSGNRMVQQGLTTKGLVWAFSGFHAYNWHPLTWLSHMLDCQLYGLNPAGHHFTSVLLHIATVIALFLVLRQMTGATWRSAFVAAVFAIHPLRVESVAWVAERKDVLSGLFFMLTLGAYVHYARLPWSWARYGLVILLFASGLMCKPMLVTLPVVLLLLDRWPLNRWGSETGDKSTFYFARWKIPRRVVLEKIPLLALSAAGCIVTVLAQNRALQSTESYSMPLRFANALTACAIYLRQMVWPTGLAVLYPFPRIGIPSWQVATAGALLVGVSVFAWRVRRTRPWALVGWLWYLVMLLPVVGIIQVGPQPHADRYTYLPQIGIYLAVTWLVANWLVNRLILGILMVSAVAPLMACTWRQTEYWQNAETLWTRVISCTKNNYVAHINLGTVFFQEGRIDEAITQYEKVLEIIPDSELVYFNRARVVVQSVHFNLAKALSERGREGEAISQYQKALQIEPNDLEAENNLAWLLATSPQSSLRNGAEAVQLAQQANEQAGGKSAVILGTLAAAFAEAGQFAAAEQSAQKAVEVAQSGGLQNLAMRLNGALRRYQAHLPLHP